MARYDINKISSRLREKARFNRSRLRAVRGSSLRFERAKLSEATLIIIRHTSSFDQQKSPHDNVIGFYVWHQLSWSIYCYCCFIQYPFMLYHRLPQLLRDPDPDMQPVWGHWMRPSSTVPIHSSNNDSLLKKDEHFGVVSKIEMQAMIPNHNLKHQVVLKKCQQPNHKT